MRYSHKTALAAALLACISAPAWAVNKCTGPDGAVVFQDAPCDVKSKKAETVKTWDSKLTGRSGGAEVWEFRRSADQLKGTSACLVISPVTTPELKSGQFRFTPVHVVIVASAEQSTFAVRTSTEKDLFHNDLSGMGVKLDNLEFVPLNVKGGQNVVGSSAGDRILAALPTSKSLRMRLRFWPYDALHDTMQIDTAGFASAFAQAKQCAGGSTSR